MISTKTNRKKETFSLGMLLPIKIIKPETIGVTTWSLRIKPVQKKALKRNVRACWSAPLIWPLKDVIG